MRSASLSMCITPEGRAEQMNYPEQQKYMTSSELCSVEMDPSTEIKKWSWAEFRRLIYVYKDLRKAFSGDRTWKTRSVNSLKTS